MHLVVAFIRFFFYGLLFMRIQRFFTALMILMAVILSGIYLSGMYQSFRSNEERRIEELSTNMHSSLISSLNALVTQVDAAIEWSSDENPQLSDEELRRNFYHLSILDIYRIEERDPFLWPITTEKSIVKIPVEVNGRSYQVGYALRPNRVLPLVRVEPLFNNADSVRALYFSPDAVMKFDLVSDASIIAYHLGKDIFGGVYPVSFRGGATSSIISQIDLMHKNLMRLGLSDGLMRIDDFKFVNISVGGDSGFLVGRNIEPWYQLAWLPASRGWWLILIVAMLLPSLMVMIIVRRYISLPIKAATQAMKFGDQGTPFTFRKLSDFFMPGESRTLIQEARRLAISGRKEQDASENYSDNTLSEDRLATKMQQAMLTDSVLYRGAMLLILKSKQDDVPMNGVALKSHIEAVDRSINEFRLLHQNTMVGLSSLLCGTSERYGFWLWVESQASLSVVAEHLMLSIEKAVRQSYERCSSPYLLHVLDHDMGISASSRAMELLEFSYRNHQWNKQHSKINHLSATILQKWEHESTLLEMAEEGFSYSDISLRMTPIIKNGTGEVAYLRVESFACIDGNKPFLIPQGEWLLVDQYSTYVYHFVMKSISLLHKIKHWGFDNVKVAISLDIALIHHDAFWQALSTLDAGSTGRLVIELKGSVVSHPRYSAIKELYTRGVGVAFLHQRESNLLGLLGKAEYLMTDAATYEGDPSLFHSVQNAAREKTLLVCNLDRAGNYFRTSLFCLPGDCSVVYCHQWLNETDALRFMQRDIAMNVLAAGLEPVSADIDNETGSLDEAPDSNIVPFRLKLN